jgi:hypothetical protein
MTISRTLFISDIIGRIIDGIILLGIKHDKSGDPAAVSPGKCFRVYCEGIEPMHDSQSDTEQEVFEARLSLVVSSQTSGGNRAQTSVELAGDAERIANMLKAMHDTYTDVELSWSGARVFVSDGDLTKLAMTITVDY